MNNKFTPDTSIGKKQNTGNKNIAAKCYRQSFSGSGLGMTNIPDPNQLSNVNTSLTGTGK
jgi:hypothetical protein